MHKRLLEKRQTKKPTPMPKKRQTKKSVPAPGRAAHFSWGWMPALLALVIACLVLLAFALNHSQVSTVDSTLPPTVTGSNVPISMGSSTPGVRQTTGIFPLSTGGPIPVPANVLHPTNIARVVVNNVLTSIYAGSLARTPALGAVAILQENLTTGQQSLHLYQTSQPVGALTILAVRNNILTLSTAKAKGTFNLATNQFHF